MTMTSKLLAGLLLANIVIAAPEGYVCPPGVTAAEVEAILTAHVAQVFNTSTNTASPWANTFVEPDGRVSVVFHAPHLVWIDAKDMTQIAAAKARASLKAAAVAAQADASDKLLALAKMLLAEINRLRAEIEAVKVKDVLAHSGSANDPKPGTLPPLTWDQARAAWTNEIGQLPGIGATVTP